MSSIISLKDRQTESTRKLIVTTAIDLLQRSGVAELTVRAVATEAGMSERTVFRYFPTRDEFLDAVAIAAIQMIDPPDAPRTIEELLDLPKRLYRVFEARSDLVTALLHTEIYQRVRRGTTHDRWRSVAKLIDKEAPHRTKGERKIAAMNANYYLTASTWHYLRFNFELSLDEAILCAYKAVALTIEDISSA